MKHNTHKLMALTFDSLGNPHSDVLVFVSCLDTCKFGLMELIGKRTSFERIDQNKPSLFYIVENK